MSQLNKASLNDKFNNTLTGLFKSGQARGIGSDDFRTMMDDLRDSIFNLLDHAYNGAAGFKPGINTIAGLKTILTAGKDLGIMVAFRDTGNSDLLRVYELVSGNSAESSPDIIRPGDYATTTNERIWKLARTSVTGLANAKETTIPQATMINGFSAPITVIPAQGAGIMINPIGFMVTIQFSGAAFATNTSFRFEINGVPVSATDSVILPSTVNRTVFVPLTTLNTTTDLSNQPCVLKVLTGNPTGGGSCIVFVTAVYSTLNVN